MIGDPTVNPPFGTLDFLYTPSTDVGADARYFVDVLGAELVFAIESDGIRVAMLRLSTQPPAILLTDHLDGDRPVLVYRVPDLADAVASLESRGFERQRMIELPPGPATSFRTPRGHRIALYESSRSYVLAGFGGRRDFEV